MDKLIATGPGLAALNQIIACLQKDVTCSLCRGIMDNPHTFNPGCGHCFCKDCVLATLEGPGITRSECPDCGQPVWKNHLKPLRQLHDIIDSVQRLLTLQASLTAVAAAAGGPGASAVQANNPATQSTSKQQPQLALIAARASDGASNGQHGAGTTAAQQEVATTVLSTSASLLVATWALPPSLVTWATQQLQNNAVWLSSADPRPEDEAFALETVLNLLNDAHSVAHVQQVLAQLQALLHALDAHIAAPADSQGHHAAAVQCTTAVAHRSAGGVRHQHTVPEVVAAVPTVEERPECEIAQAPGPVLPQVQMANTHSTAQQDVHGLAAGSRGPSDRTAHSAEPGRAMVQQVLVPVAAMNMAPEPAAQEPVAVAAAAGCLQQALAAETLEQATAWHTGADHSHQSSSPLPARKRKAQRGRAAARMTKRAKGKEDAIKDPAATTPTVQPAEGLEIPCVSAPARPVPALQQGVLIAQVPSAAMDMLPPVGQHQQQSFAHLQSSEDAMQEVAVRKAGHSVQAQPAQAAPSTCPVVVCAAASPRTGPVLDSGQTHQGVLDTGAAGSLQPTVAGAGAQSTGRQASDTVQAGPDPDPQPAPAPAPAPAVTTATVLTNKAARVAPGRVTQPKSRAQQAGSDGHSPALSLSKSRDVSALAAEVGKDADRVRDVSAGRGGRGRKGSQQASQPGALAAAVDLTAAAASQERRTRALPGITVSTRPQATPVKHKPVNLYLVAVEGPLRAQVTSYCRNTPNAVLSQTLTRETTHCVVQCDNQHRAVRRTLHYLTGLLHGCHMVRQQWVVDSMRAGAWQDEADYIVQGDPYTVDTGVSVGLPALAEEGGAARARRRLLNGLGCKLFDGVSYHLVANTEPDAAKRDNLVTLLTLGGADQLHRPQRSPSPALCVTGTAESMASDMPGKKRAAVGAVPGRHRAAPPGAPAPPLELSPLASTAVRQPAQGATMPEPVMAPSLVVLVGKAFKQEDYDSIVERWGVPPTLVDWVKDSVTHFLLLPVAPYQNRRHFKG